MDYNFNLDYLYLDIPNRNRLIIRRDELKYIKEFLRNTTEVYCEIKLADGTIYKYSVSMDEIINNLKPLPI